MDNTEVEKAMSIGFGERREGFTVIEGVGMGVYKRQKRVDSQSQEGRAWKSTVITELRLSSDSKCTLVKSEIGEEKGKELGELVNYLYLTKRNNQMMKTALRRKIIGDDASIFRLEG